MKNPLIYHCGVRAKLKRHNIGVPLKFTPFFRYSLKTSVSIVQYIIDCLIILFFIIWLLLCVSIFMVLDLIGPRKRFETGKGMYNPQIAYCLYDDATS